MTVAGEAVLQGAVPPGPMPAAGEEMSGWSDADLAAALQIRHFEFAVLDCFARGDIAGTTHTCLGQEYVPVAVDALLRRDDYVFSNHRGHGHFLARFRDPAGLLAEIMGREGGVCGGYGGSQHILHERYMSTGVQGESVAVATGVAVHLQHEAARSGSADGPLACAYIGDGTWGQGVVYESLNIASRWKLPLLVVVENNAIAQSTPTRTTMAGTIAARAAAFDVPYARCDSVDVNVVRRQLAPVIAGVRARSGPAIVELTPPRLGPHSKGDDTRDEAELAVLRRRDWAVLYRNAHAAQFDRIDAQQRAAIADVVREVSDRPMAGMRDV